MQFQRKGSFFKVSPNETLGPTSWPLTLTPERSTATQSNTVRLWCSLVISFKKVSQDREQSAGRSHTHSNAAALQLTLYPGADSSQRFIGSSSHDDNDGQRCTRGAVPHSRPWVFTVAFTAVAPSPKQAACQRRDAFT